MPLQQIKKYKQICWHVQDLRRANTKKTGDTEVAPGGTNLQKHLDQENLEKKNEDEVPSSQASTLELTGGTPKKKDKMTAAKSKASPKAKGKGKGIGQGIGSKAKNAKNMKTTNPKKPKVDTKKGTKVKSAKKGLGKDMTFDDVKKTLHAVLRLAVFFAACCLMCVTLFDHIRPNFRIAHLRKWVSVV